MVFSLYINDVETLLKHCFDVVAIMLTSQIIFLNSLIEWHLVI